MGAVTEYRDGEEPCDLDSFKPASRIASLDIL